MSVESADQVKRAVGRRVAEIRRDRGLTQASLAALMSDDPSARITPQYVGLIEQGRENLTIEALVRIAMTLGVPVRALFDPPASMDPTPRGRPPSRERPPQPAARSREAASPNKRRSSRT